MSQYLGLIRYLLFTINQLLYSSLLLTTASAMPSQNMTVRCREVALNLLNKEYKDWFRKCLAILLEMCDYKAFLFDYDSFLFFFKCLLCKPCQAS